MRILKSLDKFPKIRPCKALITTQKLKSMQKLGTPYLLLFHVQTRAEFFSFHELILNPKIFLPVTALFFQKICFSVRTS